MSSRVAVLIAERELGAYALKQVLKMPEIQLGLVATDVSSWEDRWWPGPSVPDLCASAGIRCISSDDTTSFEMARDVCPEPDCVLSVLNNLWVGHAYLKWPKSPPVHLHGAPLPEYQGNNCTHFAIMNDEPYFGATLYATSHTRDCGDILARRAFPVPPECTNYKLHQLTVEAGKRLIDELVPSVLTGMPRITEAFDDNRAVWYDAMGSRQVTFDGTMSGEEIDRIARAFYFPPFEPAYFEVQGKRFYVFPRSVYSAKPK